MPSTTEIACFLWTLAALLLAWILIQHLTRRHDLLSFRNLFLIGFGVFQLHDAATSLTTGDYRNYGVLHPSRAGTEFAAMASIFLVAFLLVYHQPWRKSVREPDRAVEHTVTGILTVAVVLAVGSFVLRFGAQYEHVVEQVAILACIGGAASACALAGWAWARQPHNPGVLVVGAFVATVSTAVALQDAFSRRGLLSLFLALIWGAYYGRWRLHSATRSLWRVAVALIVPLLFVAAFTSVRKSGQFERTAQENWSSIKQESDLSAGLESLTAASGCGSAALWSLETHPTPFEYRPLMTIEYFFLLPVPRSWWPDKPVPLGKTVAELAGIGQVDQDVLTIPAGVVGNAGGEGGWYALLTYAVILGLGVRYLDRLRLRWRNAPFSSAALISAGGQMLGMARGEIAVFAFILVFSVASSTLILRRAERVLLSRPT